MPNSMTDGDRSATGHPTRLPTTIPRETFTCLIDYSDNFTTNISIILLNGDYEPLIDFWRHNANISPLPGKLIARAMGFG